MRFIAMACSLALLAGCQRQSPNAAIKPGQDIDAVSKTMSRAAYHETGLDMATLSSNSKFKMWSVGKGVLICRYSTQNTKVQRMSYFLCDERPKATRKTFEFNVKAFNPRTKEMKIVMPGNPNRGDSK